ncbi:MAG: CocE/NonD family hydrolase [Actinomycetota bacterium]
MSRRRLSLAVLSFLLFSGLVLAVPAAAEPVPEGATWTQLWLPSQDGTLLRADLMLPANRAEGDRHPVILSIGPYFGRNPLNMSPGDTGPFLRFNDLITEGRIFERGYAYMQVDSRGYGGSQGCNDFGGPGEQMDTEAAVNWAARQPWSNGNVGMWGKSYDAWTQVMALAENPVGLKAAVIQSPLLEAYRGMFMNGVHYDSGWYATPTLYRAFDLAPTSTSDAEPEEHLYPAMGTLTNPACNVETTALTTIYDHDLEYWQRRDIIDAAARSRVPVLWSHGFNDANTKADNFMEVWSRLKGPKRAWFGQWDHVRGNESAAVGRLGFMDEAMDWFDHYLKGMPLVKHPAIEIQDGDGKWRTERAWPPRDAKGHAFSLNPGAYTDEAGNQAALPGAGAWTFTEPAPYDIRYAGTPVVTADVQTLVPNVNLVALLYDVAPDGAAKFMSRGAFLVEEAGEVSFALYPQDWLLRKGHRIGLQLAGADDSWFTPIHTGTDATVSGGTVEIPFLGAVREANLKGTLAAAQGGVPAPRLDPQMVEDNTVDGNYPRAPRNARRPRSR